MGLLLLAIEGTVHFPELAIIMLLTHRLPDDCPISNLKLTLLLEIEETVEMRDYWKAEPLVYELTLSRVNIRLHSPAADA